VFISHVAETPDITQPYGGADSSEKKTDLAAEEAALGL